MIALLLIALLLSGAIDIGQVRAAEPDLKVVAIATEDPPGFVQLTINVTNAGGADSGLITLIAALPEHNWQLVGDNWGDGDCALEDDLLTGSGFVEKRGPNDDDTNYENGLASCVLIAQVSPCGSYSTQPYIIHARGSDTGEIIDGNTASWSKSCATPTPVVTATLVAPTATPVPPTATPQPPTPFVVTATPTQGFIVVTATPTNTPVRIAPLPPNTGEGTSLQPSTDRGLVAVIGIIALTLSFMVAGLFVRRRR